MTKWQETSYSPAFCHDSNYTEKTLHLVIKAAQPGHVGGYRAEITPTKSAVLYVIERS